MVESKELELDLAPEYYRPFLKIARSVFDDTVYDVVCSALRVAVDQLKGDYRNPRGRVGTKLHRFDAVARCGATRFDGCGASR